MLVIETQRPMKLHRAFHYACIDGVPRRSLLIAFVVGTLLNVINQGEALFGHAPLNWAKLSLTYLVPYCVATYGAVSYRLRADRTPPVI